MPLINSKARWDLVSTLFLLSMPVWLRIRQLADAQAEDKISLLIQKLEGSFVRLPGQIEYLVY